jgi:hypothetical protein
MTHQQVAAVTAITVLDAAYVYTPSYLP